MSYEFSPSTIACWRAGDKSIVPYQVTKQPRLIIIPPCNNQTNPPLNLNKRAAPHNKDSEIGIEKMARVR